MEEEDDDDDDDDDDVSVYHNSILITIHLECSSLFVSCGAAAPTRAMASTFLRFLDHTQRRITVDRTPLDE